MSPNLELDSKLQHFVFIIFPKWKQIQIQMQLMKKNIKYFYTFFQQPLNLTF